MILFTFLAAWAILHVASETAIGRWLNRALVVSPAERFSRIRRGHVLLVLLAAAMIAAIGWLLHGDGIAVLGMGAPDMVPFLTSIEASTVLDMLAAVIVSASVLRLRALKGAVSIALVRLRPARPRARRARRERTSRPADNDEDGPATLRLAA